MQTPTVIIAEPTPGRYHVSVSGRFGGGFQNLALDREGVIGRLSYLKSFDCGKEPASIICPQSLEPEFRKVFPRSFQD
jgi:hypothetical protein